MHDPIALTCPARLPMEGPVRRPPCPRPPARRGSLAPAILLAVALLAACGGDPGGPRVATVGEALLVPGDDVPEVADPVVAVSGDVAVGAVGLDVPTLESLGTVEVTIEEPWLEEEIAFTGVWFSDLLAVLDPGDDADAVDLHALDDYSVSFPLEDLVAGDALLATRADGDPIPVSAGGPVRLLFLDRDGPGSNLDLWIWSIDALSVG